MSTYPAARSNVRATVKTTAAIINLIIIIILDEVYAAIARWLTTLGEAHFTHNTTAPQTTYYSYFSLQMNWVRGLLMPSTNICGKLENMNIYSLYMTFDI